MSLAEILKEISPCDTQKPYIFFSYSNQDKDVVWRDALALQNLGYNIWLDEKNIDKTKASWKEDALRAIEDIYCMLVVFYVSKSSLISEACFREMAKTKDDTTVAFHYGPVKFIAVDVESIGNISDYTKLMHQSIIADHELSKEQKMKNVYNIHQFMKEFFDHSNEKVRVHPKNEVGRTKDYYEEIVACFPQETCNLLKEPVKVVEPHKVEVSASVVPRKVVFEADLWEEKVLKAIEYANASRPKDTVFLFRKVREIGEEIVNCMIRSLEQDIKVADVLGVASMPRENYHEAVGWFLVTKDRMYALDFFKKNIELRRVKTVKIADKKYNIEVTYENGKRDILFASAYSDMVLSFFEKLIEDHKVVQTKNSYVTSGEQKINEKTDVHIMEAIAKVNQEATRIGSLHRIWSVEEYGGEEKVKKVIKNSIPGLEIYDIQGLISIKPYYEGYSWFVITREQRIYSDNFNDPGEQKYMDLKQIKEAKVADPDHYIDIVYKNGKKHRFFVSAFAKIIKMFLNAYLE